MTMTSTATMGTGSVDCEGVEIPGCTMVVEVCQGGQCECLCADAPTTGADGSGTDADTGAGSGDTGPGEGICPEDAQPTDPPTVCDAPATSCTKVGGCCRCDVVAGCGDDPIWWCVELVPDPACPPSLPAVDEVCDANAALCSYCDGAASPVYRSCSGGTWQDPGGLGCAG